MKLWAVFQEGVYRHSCGGIYDSLEKATAAADQIAATDVDDYHQYQVVPFTLNVNDEGEVLYDTNREKSLTKLGPHEGDCGAPPGMNGWRRCKCSRGNLDCKMDQLRFAPPRQGEEK